MIVMPLKLAALRLFIAVCITLSCVLVQAQQKTITGKITDAKNAAVAGASVSVKGTNLGTFTDENGNYSIQAPPDATLVVSFVGFESTEVKTGGRSAVNITLSDKTTTLADVVVTGYTSQARKDITGSVTVVKAEDLKSIPAANAEAQLQGRAAGVTVTPSGVPGVGATVRIRGFGSFTSNDPLYVVDGIQTNSISGINPNDIESLTVLKDAAAASIYGSRASNGVIVVTTKRGRTGAAKVSYNAYYGRQDPGKGFTNLLNPTEMANLLWLASRNSGQTPPATQYGTGTTPVLPDFILAGTSGGVNAGDPRVDPSRYTLDPNNPGAAYLIIPANKAGTNWFDEVTQVAPIQNHNLSLSAGSDRSRFFFSADYFDQKAITIHNYFKRYSARLNTEFNIKKNIRIGENLQVWYQQDNLPGNNNEGTPIALAYRQQPIIPVYDVRGNFAGTRAPGLGNASNPVANQTRARDNLGQSLNIAGNLYAEVDFLRHFTARTSFAGTMGNANYFFYGFRTFENAENNTGNSYTEGSNRSRNWNWTNQVTYRNTFGGVHDLNVLAGTEAVEGVFRFMETGVAGLFSDAPIFRSISNGSTIVRAVGAPATPTSLVSYFGKVDYTYKDKYLLSGTIRRDGSSRFGSLVRWGTFPAGSIGWRISQENFMKNVGWIRDLKLRASYGVMGNQQPVDPINQFSVFAQAPGNSFYDINGASTSTVPGFFAAFTGNPSAKWERNITQNFGFDASLFGGKTEIVFDYYIKSTDDLLYRLPLSATLGASPNVNPAASNVASMRNSGIDLMVTQRGVLGRGTRKFNLDATLTFTTYKNEITGIAEGIDFFDAAFLRNGGYVRNQVGSPVSAFFGYKVLGLFQNAQEVTNAPQQDGAAPGRFRYADINGDNRITPDDRTIIGDPNPDFTYGLNLNATYGAFDASVFFYGVQGRDMVNYTRYWIDFFPSFQGAKSRDLLYNSWTDKNTGARTPIAENVSNFSNNAVANSYYIENGSYLRLRNLTLGYTLPQSMTERLKIDRLRVYVQGTNLFTITNYTGLDPEVTPTQGDVGFGVDAGAYPMVKQYLVGINLNF